MLIPSTHGGRKAARAELAYLGANAITTDGAFYNHGNFNAPKPGLMIVVQCGGRENLNRSVSAISIGGSNGILIAPAADDQVTTIGYRAVNAGNNAVTVSISGGELRCNVVNVFLLTGYRSATPADSGSASEWSASSRNLGLTIPSGGVALYGVASFATGGGISWSDATERYDQTVDSLLRISAASLQNVNGSHTETVTFNSSAEGAEVYACWR